MLFLVVKMWQCSFCSYTSSRKGNVQAHGKKGNIRLDKINNTIQNARIENTKIGKYLDIDTTKSLKKKEKKSCNNRSI